MKRRDRTARFILEMVQRCAGDLVAVQEPHCCCLDLCQIWLRLAMETKKPSDLCGLARMMEGLKGGGRMTERKTEREEEEEGVVLVGRGVKGGWRWVTSER